MMYFVKLMVADEHICSSWNNNTDNCSAYKHSVYCGTLTCKVLRRNFKLKGRLGAYASGSSYG